MAGDDEEKTEEPTQRRISEAVKKGQISFSREVTNLFMFVVLSLNIIWFAPYYMRLTTLDLAHFIQSPEDIIVDEGGLQRLFISISASVAMLLFLPILGSLVAAIGSSFLQNGWTVSTEPLMPKLEKISLLAGIKRIFSIKSLMEFIKGLIKITVVAIACYMVVEDEFDRLEQTITYSMKDLLEILVTLSFRIMIAATSIMFVIAALDIVFQKLTYIKQLRMSRQELKEEYRQSEGDPVVKQRLRQIRMERARRRMMSAVPEADVVIRNPTHYAIALKYEEGTMRAPMVTAKGADLIALKIIEIAEANKVTIVENPPLARALFESAEMDEEIPLQHYQAVAEVIGYLYRLKGRR